MCPKSSIRPVIFKEQEGLYRIVADIGAMTEALVRHCDPASATFRIAAQSFLHLLVEDSHPEIARGAFIEALSAANIAVRRERSTEFH